MSKIINKILLGFCSFVLVLFASVASGDITNVLPQAYEVYGGTIGVIDAIPVPGENNKTRVFVSTDSANSVFYADVDYSNPEPFGTNFMFRVVPDMDANASLGVPNWIAAHQQSGRIFACVSSGLVSCTTSSGSLTTNIAAQFGFSFVLIQDSHLFAVSYGSPTITPQTIFYGTLNADGNLTLGPSVITNFSGQGYNSVKLAVNPVSRKLYVLAGPGGGPGQTNSPSLLKSSDNYDNFSSGTYFSPVSLTGVTITSPYVLTVGPDGRLFLGGTQVSGADLAWSDDDGASWTNLATSGSGSGSGLNIVCSGNSNAYEVYFGNAVSSNKGSTGTWFRPRSHLHAVNPGSTEVDPLNSNVAYFPMDRGFGVSTNANAGVDVTELINGLLAVQIYAIDVLPSKSVAWLGSKAGIRIATNFNITPVWTDGDFPALSVNSIAIDKTDPSGMTCYAAGGACVQGLVFKTATGGGTNASDWRCIFTNELSDGGVSSLKATGNFIVFGYSTAYPPTSDAGVYITQDGGSNWNHVMTNVNVNKLLFLEKDGTGVIYAAMPKTSSDGSPVDHGGGIYRIDTNSLTAVLDMTNEVDIRDLAADSMGNIYASGTVPDVIAGRHKPVAYYKGTNSSEWTQLPTNGLPGDVENGFMYVPLAVGKDNASNDVPVLAALRTVYYLPYGGSSWVSVANYPNGTRIMTLFYDELMVGTTVGLYGQGLNTEPVVTAMPLAADFDGDQLADPALYNTNGNWKIKLSSGGYTLIPLTGFLGGSGYTALAADFDGDSKADPAIYNAVLELWVVKLSSLNYLAPTVLTAFGGPGWAALAGDFDGDRLADPALYNTNGTWQVKLSTAGYATITSAGLLGYADWTAVAADFDGDGKVDPAIYKAATGVWIVMLSKTNYNLAVLEQGFLGSAGYIGMAADFDGDGYADPAVAQASTGNWQIKLSSAGYSTIPLNNFLGE